MAMRCGFATVDDAEWVGFFAFIAAVGTGLAVGSAACAGVARDAPNSEATMRAGMAKFERIGKSSWLVITISHQITSYPSCRNNLMRRVNLRTIVALHRATRRRIVKSMGAITRPRDVGKICRLQSRHAIGFVPAKQPLLISLLEQVSRFCAPPVAAWCGHSVRSGLAPPTAGAGGACNTRRRSEPSVRPEPGGYAANPRGRGQPPW